MQIAIDVTPLKDSGHSVRGIGSYTNQLIEALQKYEQRYSYIFFTRKENIPRTVDLVHYPYFDPFFLTLPLVKPKRTVVTVHDLIPLVFPEAFPRGVKGSMKWLIQRWSLRQAAAVITDSKRSKADIVSIAGIEKNRVFPVYLAASERFTPHDDRLTNAKVRLKLGIPEYFILFVGDINWNKNIKGLLDAFSLVKKQDNKFSNKDIQDHVKLVLVGKALRNSRLEESHEIIHYVESLGLTDDVALLGYVSDEELSSLYHLASVYVQPSFYEGFGLPPLEAMASGCPTIVTNRGSLPEIAGPSLVVEPDPGSLAAAIIETLLSSPKQYEKLSLSSIRWASRFSWKRVAEETVNVYEKALEGY